ncbi:MAG: type II secretion system minor pseudopilin GspH [Proteobacteria bacterium]|nr:type II secretion system minor pseudopilin GspH [Pseudomonadota bacterium]
MRARRRQSGFTLIEMLVVIVIVATIISLAMLSVGVVGEDEELDKERRRLASLIETVQDDAMLQGREFGIELMTSSYRFVEFDPFTRQWAEVPGDELYRLRELPPGIEFELFIDGKRIPLERDPKKLADPDEPMTRRIEPFAPHLFVFASGEATVFELHLRRPQTDGRLVMRGDVLGEIRFGEDDDEN